MIRRCKLFLYEKFFRRRKCIYVLCKYMKDEAKFKKGYRRRRRQEENSNDLRFEKIKLRIAR